MHEPRPGTIRADFGFGVEAGYDLDEIEVPHFSPTSPKSAATSPTPCG